MKLLFDENLSFINTLAPKAKIMNTLVLKQVPKGEDLTRAVLEMEEHDLREHHKAQIQRGLDASNAPNAPRTAHADFMTELKGELMNRIDAR